MLQTRLCVVALTILGFSCGGTGNHAPIAAAGPDQNVLLGSRITLDGSPSSDADGDFLSYRWSFTAQPSGSTAALSNTDAVQPTFVADAAGTYVISLVVNDGGSNSTPDNVTITATPPPDTENADRLFDLNQMHTFDIEVAPADWEWLNANALLEKYVPATLIFEGRRIENIGLRFKGSYNTLDTCFDANGNRICPKLSIKLKFNEYVKATRFKGLRKLNFNSSIRDKTFLHEVITYYLFRQLGVPAPRASHALINVNGEPQGLFVMVEEVDDEFIKSYWPTATGGNLYKSIWPQYNDSAPYIATLENNKAAPNVSRMLTLTETAQTCTDEAFPTAVSTQLDLPSIAKYLAVDRAVFADDGVQIFYCSDATTAECVNNNYYWYEVPGGPSELIPWDVDYTLAEVNTDLGRSNWNTSAEACVPVPYCDYMLEPGCDPADHNEWILRPQCQQLFGLMHRATWNDYRLALRQLANGPMSRANIVPLMDSLVYKIRPLVAADTHGPGSAIWEDYVDWMYYVLDEQVAEINRLLAEP